AVGPVGAGWPGGRAPAGALGSPAVAGVPAEGPAEAGTPSTIGGVAVCPLPRSSPVPNSHQSRPAAASRSTAAAMDRTRRRRRGGAGPLPPAETAVAAGAAADEPA